jgi:murein L,D-transpeptidase YafK
MRRRKLILLGGFAVVVAAALLFHERVEIAAGIARQRFGKRSVKDRLDEFGDAARNRWSSYFSKTGIEYPPKKIMFIVFKDERTFEVYGSDGAKVRFIRRYPILAASGRLGPKLREGDNQVPEGIYEIESLNPNSAYHVSLRLNYPNAFDRAQAAKDGRTQLGGDIMIHGKSVSVGCIAVGDEAAEDLFTLAADVGIKNVKVICSPVDFRKRRGVPRDFQPSAGTFEWTMVLYQEIYSQLPAARTP